MQAKESKLERQFTRWIEHCHLEMEAGHKSHQPMTEGGRGQYSQYRNWSRVVCDVDGCKWDFTDEGES